MKKTHRNTILVVTWLDRDYLCIVTGRTGPRYSVHALNTIDSPNLFPSR